MISLIIQIVISFILIGLIVMQSKGTGLSATFGGSNNYHAKRGIEKSLFYFTIVFSVVFVALAIINAI